MVIRPNGRYEVVQRQPETGALSQVNMEEKEKFMSGKKLVAIISSACSTGISLRADNKVRNRRRRVHITLELPFSSEVLVQQLGRTHR